MSAGSEAFSPFIYLDVAKFVMLGVFPVVKTTKTTCPKI